MPVVYVFLHDIRAFPAAAFKRLCLRFKTSCCAALTTSRWYKNCDI